MALLAGAAAAAWGGGELFSYNRENFMFDKDLLLKRDYQAQRMRVKRKELYREDIRDLVQLTVRKMDNYLVVSTLQLGFCMTLYVEGRPKPGIGLPHWLMHLFAMCNAGAFLYYLLSIWLSMHASVAAHAFGVRLLTQVVRLPIPDDATLAKSRFAALQYEGNKVNEMFRVPVLQKQLQRLTQAMDKNDEEDSEVQASLTSETNNTDSNEEDINEENMKVVDLPHIQTFRAVQARWQAYDAFARVCMAMGTNQLLHTLSYMMLGTLVGENDVPFPAFSCVVIFTTCAWVLARLDVYLSRKILIGAAVLLVLPPTIVTASFALHRGFCNIPHHMKTPATLLYRALVPTAFFLHIVWIVFTLFMGGTKKDPASGVDLQLPRHFRAVLYLDVFAWLKGDQDPDDTNLAGEGPGESPGLQSSPRESMAEELPPEALQAAIAACRQLQARLAEDLRRFESDDVSRMLGENERKTREALRRKFDKRSATFKAMEEMIPSTGSSASSSSAEALQSSQRRDAGRVWVAVELESHGGLVFRDCESGDCKFGEEPADGRTISIGFLERDVEKFAQTISTIEPHWRHFSRAQTGLSDAENIARTPFDQCEQADTQACQQQSEQSLRKSASMPWRTVKQGSIMLITMWSLSLVWVITLTFFETFHDQECSTFDAALAAGASSRTGTPGALLQHLSHDKHKVTFALPQGEAVQFDAPRWPTAFARPVSLACHPGFDAMLVSEKYSVHVLQAAVKPDPHLQDNIDRCIFGEPDFQAQGIRSISLHCEADANCSLWVLAENGHQLLRCFLGSTGELIDLKGGPWRHVQIQNHQELWALRSMGTLDDEKDQIVLLRRSCPQCDFLPSRDLDVPGHGIDFLLRWPGVSWLFASSNSEELLRGFYLNDSVPKPLAKFIELHQQRRRGEGERWLGGCVGNQSLYILEDLGQSADQRWRIIRRRLETLMKCSLSPL